MNGLEKKRLLVQVAKLYYEDDLCQKEISGKLNISRSYVSKLLIESRKLGIVKITINNHFSDDDALKQMHQNRSVISPAEMQGAKSSEKRYYTYF
jgi:Transcriptional regulator, contains sigma factor-related N-terminal domain